MHYGFCPYDKHCKFAHGQQELQQKEIYHAFYRTRHCQKFFTDGWCPYGVRCNFMHDDRKLDTLKKSSLYYTLLLKNQNLKQCKGYQQRRLKVFSHLEDQKETTISDQNKLDCYNLNKESSFRSQIIKKEQVEAKEGISQYFQFKMFNILYQITKHEDLLNPPDSQLQSNDDEQIKSYAFLPTKRVLLTKDNNQFESAIIEERISQNVSQEAKQIDLDLDLKEKENLGQENSIGNRQSQKLEMPLDLQFTLKRSMSLDLKSRQC